MIPNPWEEQRFKIVKINYGFEKRKRELDKKKKKEEKKRAKLERPSDSKEESEPETSLPVE